MNYFILGMILVAFNVIVALVGELNWLTVFGASCGAFVAGRACGKS